MDMYAIVRNIFEPFLNIFNNLITVISLSAIAIIILFFAFFFIRYRVNPFKPKLAILRQQRIAFLPYDLLRYLYIDLCRRKTKKFTAYGFTIFVGRQGGGKTISMVQYLNNIHLKYPKCLIVTNFKYKYADRNMTDWRDFFDVRNGLDGVVFAIDEIHSEYSSDSWKDFPETLLSEISQQRKQHIKIVCTSQVYKRIAKPIRDQAFTIVTCHTYFKRLVRTKEYDAAEYDDHIGGGYTLSKGIKALSKKWYVQSDYLRKSYDTYEKIKRLGRTEFIERSKR